MQHKIKLQTIPSPVPLMLHKNYQLRVSNIKNYRTNYSNIFCMNLETLIREEAGKAKQIRRDCENSIRIYNLWAIVQ